jgi:hypothetical protein
MAAMILPAAVAARAAGFTDVEVKRRSDFFTFRAGA